MVPASASGTPAAARQHCGVRRISLQGIGDALVQLALWLRGGFARYQAGGRQPSALGKK